MRYLFFQMTALILLTISCKKNTPAIIAAGTYQGTFQRSTVNKISNVTVKFSSNNFEGQSQYIHYPDICNGTFLASRDTVSFEDACVYTADFDWSYILSGKFKILVFEDSLIMTKTCNGSANYYDIYKLKRQ